MAAPSAHECTDHPVGLTHSFLCDLCVSVVDYFSGSLFHWLNPDMQAYLAIGGNQGDVQATMRSAVEQLSQVDDISAVELSPIYSTAPVGVDAQFAFHNAAIVCETALPPLDLLDVMQRIEHSAGRERTVRWGPRTLDIDLIGYGPEVMSHPRLTLPHPAAWYRRFVLDPLCDVAADWMHPERQATVRELRDRLRARPLMFAFGDDELSSQFAEGLAAAFSAETLLVQRAGETNSMEPTWLLIDRRSHPERWETAANISRLPVDFRPELELQDLVDVVNSAVDEPIRHE
ncbi:2-amino-4-hydroxy-6-hydroxymethyldihydropteridine diphosphokinase [bacterium]|nr:2-amino-4-hydroxy-6-hydroxymethyldihydropteridine diphosphokinase [bacterium]